MSEYIGDTINCKFKGKSIISIDQFGRNDFETLFKEAEQAELLVKKHGRVPVLDKYILNNVFYEASTRTSSSFAAAMMRYKGAVIQVNDAASFSSVTKGESLQDTIRSFEQYGDVTVLRHPQIGAAAAAAKVSGVPIINAGDGAGEHPTQAILDMHTIMQQHGHLDGLTITMVGDLKHGRTVHSLAKALSMFKGIKLNYVSPPELAMPKEYQQIVKKRGITQAEYVSLEDALPKSDVLYAVRMQGERFVDQSEYDRLKNSYRVTPKTLKLAKKKMKILHPLPRNAEISTDIDTDPRAAYFKQMQYGMYCRMALLALVLGESGFNVK